MFSNMAGFKEFLESSTIHGLVHISNNTRLVRLVWIFIVLSGFSGAGILIHQSFSSWSSSPVTTTIETVSISDLDFPNVTVCPPENSFTGLNVDLIRAKNFSFDEEKRRELSSAVVDAVFYANLLPRLKELKAYEGYQKYKNWYSGVTAV